MPGSMGWTVIWLSLLMCIVSCRPEAEQPPHVIVVSVDTLNRDALRCLAESADGSLRLPARLRIVDGGHRDRAAAALRPQEQSNPLVPEQRDPWLWRIETFEFDGDSDPSTEE